MRTFADIEELVGAASELERVLGELGETPLEPLKEELEEGAAEASMGHQVAVLNDTLINFFKGGVPNSVPLSSSTLHRECQICKGKNHIATTCPRFYEPRPKCAKCGMPHRTDNCGVKCSFCSGLGHSEDRCWKKPKDGRSNSGAANFLEVLLDDEAAIAEQLNRFCENENVFSYTRLPRRRQPVELTSASAGPSAEVAEDGTVTNREHPVRSKILSHFIKGKISLTPMETVMMIPCELEQLENLVKVARRKKDAEAEGAQVSMVSAVPAVRRICVNRTHKSKTLHLSVEINSCLIEGLVDTGASMSVMAAVVVRELGLMHMVYGSETYKTASGAITQALSRIGEVPIKVGGVQCNMTFMVLNTDNYDVLLGLDLLIKIGAIVDVEQGLIQVRRGPGTNVEILPLTVVNLVQRSDSGVDVRGEDGCVKRTSERSSAEDLSSSRCADGIVWQMSAQESESESDSSEDADGTAQLEGQVEGESEFGDTELENLVMLEGPQQILQLTLQNQADEFMKEEITNDDDYADWIRWAANGEGRKKGLSQTTEATKESVLLQIQEVETTASDDRVREQIADGLKDDTRWKDICQKLKINQDLDELRRSLLWRLIGRYQDVFA